MPIRDFAIQNLHATGMSYKNVAKKFGLSLQRVTVIVKRPAMLSLEAKLLVNKERARKWTESGYAHIVDPKHVKVKAMKPAKFRKAPY